MPTVDRRPSLPIGTPIQGFDAISAAIHVDNHCEAYLLGAPGPRQLVYLLVGAPDEAREEVEGCLNAWWRILGSANIALEARTVRHVGPHARASAVLRPAGQWAGAGAVRFRDDREPWALLKSLVTLVIAARQAKLAPVLTPSLIWVSRTRGQVETIPLIAVSDEAKSDQERLRALGHALYSLISGTPYPDAGAPSSLSRWSRFASHELDRVVRRCAELPADQRDCPSLEAVRAEIEGHLLSPGTPAPRRTAGTPARGPVTPGSPRPRDSEGPHGLAKVAGMHELKALLQEQVVKPLRNPETYRRYGLGIPNGVLLYGPSGCGKTHIARQLAEELELFFHELIPSEVASPYIHQSVLNIREAFDTAAEHAPSVLFIDECEALMPPRTEVGAHQHYRAEEVTELLSQLNNASERRILVVAATNEPERIDPAMRRSGRLDKLVYVGPPDLEARAEMLAMHLHGRPTDEAMELKVLALSLEGYSASDIKLLVDEAARTAMARQEPIDATSLMEAKRRVPPSIRVEDEAQYQAFGTRGV